MKYTENKFNSVKCTVNTYLIGLILSLILTIFPFLVVIYGGISYHITLFIVLACAIIQIITHLICFLHLNNSKKDRWNLLALIFSLLIITIIIMGSLWIMWNLNKNMAVN
ncbi:MAG: cytochrome o ubiquinol oxidase subunit IV [Candidatus Dasytiphilus stammeri]